MDGSDPQFVANTGMGPFVVNHVNQTIYYLHKEDGNKVKVIDYNGNALPDEALLLRTNEFNDLGLGIDVLTSK